MSLEKIFARLRQLTELRAQLKRLRFVVRFDGTAPKSVRLDGKRLMQVLLNLAHNAIKYTYEGEVHIVGRMDQDETLVVEVSDTGIGIEPVLLDRIFLIFGLVDKKVRAHETGVGIGLYLCKQIVDAMHGEIAINSSHGVGTRVTLKIPAPPPVAHLSLSGLTVSNFLNGLP